MPIISIEFHVTESCIYQTTHDSAGGWQESLEEILNLLLLVVAPDFISCDLQFASLLLSSMHH